MVRSLIIAAASARAERTPGMSAETSRRGGRGVTIAYVRARTRFGTLLAAATERGICFVSLQNPDSDVARKLQRGFPHATLREGGEALSPWVEAMVAHLHGARPDLAIPVDLAGTEFQMRVWQALREIPYGATRSYREVARSIGRPTAARAVARACATNPVPLLVPCHRVVRSDGGLGGFGWGTEVKEALLEQEARLGKS